ncbi:MAG TPA: ABC transporter ATP-binding protein [Stellaceae bacterium]|nr:ABC transporter ATP-binding protein [Stellaceae bacterium]
MSDAPARDAPLIAVEDLRVYFPSGNKRETVKAVDGVSFTVAAGETFGVIGESGSGKSTLGRALVGLVRPTGGRVLHDGEDPFALGARDFARHRRDFLIVFQDPSAALDPRMTIGHSIREPLDVADETPRSERDARVLHLLDRVGLDAEFARRYPHELSGGQKQRVNIARALALDPRLIVCDEIVAALDVSIQADLLNLLAELQRELGLTYVVITHDLGVVAHIADRIAVMYLGKLVELGPASRLMEAPLHPYTRALLSSEPVPLPSVLRTGTKIVLQGEIPSPIDPPSGCRFRTRCWLAAGRCAEVEPEWRELEPNRFVACHFAKAAEDPESAR